MSQHWFEFIVFCFLFALACSVARLYDRIKDIEDRQS